MLVPGFEPGSTDRESVMMDRTTLHELAFSPVGAMFIKSTPVEGNFTFTFTYDTQSEVHKGMSQLAYYGNRNWE